MSSDDHVTDILHLAPHLGHPVATVVDSLRALVRRDTAFSVLDVGCGFGHASCAIAAGFPTCRVWAIDMEPSVLSAARDRALRLGVECQIVFCEQELTLERRFSAPRFDVLIFLAAQQVFDAPSQIGAWLGALGAPGAVSLVDRTAVVLPGEWSREAARFEAFLSALGPHAEPVSAQSVALSRENALDCIDMFLEDTVADQRADVVAAQQRVRNGAVAHSVSALYLVRDACSRQIPK